MNIYNLLQNLPKEDVNCKYRKRFLCYTFKSGIGSRKGLTE